MSSEYFITDNTYTGFEDLENLEGTFTTVDLRQDTIAASGHPIISDGIHMLLNDQITSTFVVASTGTGKTRRILLPQIVTAIKVGHSFICHDPKSELYKHTVPLLEKNGYKVIVLDFRNPSRGEGYNPIAIPAQLIQQGKRKRGMEMLKNMGNTIMEDLRSDKDLFWHKTAAMMFQGLCGLLIDIAPLQDVTIKNMVGMLIDGDKTNLGKTYLEQYFLIHPDSIYRDLLETYICAPRETKGSLKTVFLSAMSKFIQNDEMIDFSSQSTWNPLDMIYEKTAIFLITREEGSVYNDVISIFLDQAYEVLIDEIEEKFDGVCPRVLDFFLDEFGNLAAVNKIDAKITVSRSRRIRWTLVCQSMKQLHLLYGKELADVILGNCANILYFYSNDIELLKYISDLCGTYEDESGKTKTLMSVEHLRCLDKDSGECLMLLDHKKPYVTHLPDISQYKLKILSNTSSIKEREKRTNSKFDLCAFVEQEIKVKQEECIEERAKARLEEYRKQEVARREKCNPKDMKDRLNQLIAVS